MIEQLVVVTYGRFASKPYAQGLVEKIETFRKEKGLYSVKWKWNESMSELTVGSLKDSLPVWVFPVNLVYR